MSDRRPGRTDGGVNTTPGIRRRPEFQTADGSHVAADNALDAARAAGHIRGDLRGQPSAEPEGHTYATRRRRPVGEEAHEERLDRTATSVRADRRSEREPRALEERRFTEDRELTDDERIAMLRAGYFQVALPDLPKEPGLHRVWLTTTNPRDPLAARLRMGYRLLSHETLGPSWEQHKATSGEHPGAIVINEMIAAEISEPLYQRYMTELHHNMPRESERGIFGRLEAHQSALAEKGSRLVYEGEGGGESGFDAMREASGRQSKGFE